MLFEYANTQPHYVLSFLKMYTGPVRRTKSVDSAAGDVKRRLDSVKANPAVPKFLRSWLECINTPHGLSWKAAQGLKHPFHALAHTCGSYESWHEYWLSWWRVLRAGWKSSIKLDYKPVFPEIYKDYQTDSQSSASYDADFADLISLHMSEGRVLSENQLEFVDSFLDEDVGDALEAFLWGDILPEVEGIFRNTTVLSGEYVGHIQHIQKKGGGTDYRDIAVPNRFIQNALVPCADKMYNLVRHLPRDATFDQDRFDTKIQNRVNNDTLYQGSVDLSKATDNLPFSWGEEIVWYLSRMFSLKDEDLARSIFHIKKESSFIDALEAERKFDKSYDLFKRIARARWEDEGYLIRWKVGQPLGSLPSFAMLAITHNLLVESLAAMLGLSHSPYVILGDDIVIMNKRLRSRYIRELSSRGIPLSLHKSYEGRLSEFAGKTFVRNCVPFYTSDHTPITWESLFDWQRSTGIRIPWVNVPRAIRRRIESLVRTYLRAYGLTPSSKLVYQLANSSYDLVLSCEILGRGSHLYPIPDSAEWSERAVRYFEMRYTHEDLIPDAVKHSGITLVGGCHPITLMSGEFADKDGYFLRFRPVELPAWYKAKVRPCATDAILKAAITACSEKTLERYQESNSE
jgi:hypothetical protein